MGLYELPRRTGEAHLYRLNHPLAEALVSQAKARDLSPAEIHFDYERHEGKVTLLEPLVGKSGWMTLSLFSVESLDQGEDYLIIAATTDDGQQLDEELATRLMTLPGTTSDLPPFGGESWEEGVALEKITRGRQDTIQRDISERNAHFFEAEADKLDGWADDLKVGLEREIKEIDRQIKEARRAATAALTLEKKLAGQKQIRSLEIHRNQKRRSLFDAQDRVDKQREELISEIENKLKQSTTLEQLFVLHWKLS